MKFSIITSVGSDYTTFLSDAARSVAQLEVPEGSSIEWLVWIDGKLNESESIHARTGVFYDSNDPATNKSLPAKIRKAIDLVGDIDVVVGATIKSAGTFAARNHALSRATGDFVINLDADDKLLPEAVRVVNDELRKFPEAQWVSCSADVVDEVGVAMFQEVPQFPEGEVERGAVYDAWELSWETRNKPALHPAGFVVSRDLLLAVGGWGALSAAGDTMMVLAATTLTPGVATHRSITVYRVWTNQISQALWKMATTRERHELMRRRVAALQKLFPV